MVQLNETEVKVLNAIQAVADYYVEGGCFNFDDINIEVVGITTNQLKGYISDLQKKGLLTVYGEDSYFDGCLFDYECGKVWTI